MAENKIEYQVIEIIEMEIFLTKCMVSVGTKESHAKILANCLITADTRGHFSHGLNRACK